MAGIFRTYDVMQDYQNIDFVKVGADTLQNGYVVVADTVVGTYLDGQGALYNPVKPSAITVANVGIVCAEEYYEDELGNRISISDPTVLSFTTGKRVRILRPSLNKTYFCSNDLITGTPVVGSYLIPTADDYGWTVAADLTGNPTVALKIEEINVKDTFVGLAAVTGVRLRATRVLGE
jgi:hypothetical protein